MCLKKAANYFADGLVHVGATSREATLMYVTKKKSNSKGPNTAPSGSRRPASA